MKKSSLGKRSSLSQQGSIICSDKTTQRDTGGKRSMLLKPGFATKGPRSSSADRDANATFMRKEPAIKRARSALNMDLSYLRRDSAGDAKRNTNLLNIMGPTSTPCQNAMYNFNSASTGGCRVRSSCPSAESRRASSAGGKTVRKESRPITEKSFQSDAEQKIQQFFNRDANGAAILNNGHIKPMNTNRLVEMVDYLIKLIDPRTTITKGNYVEEIIQLAKTYMYKGKVERSWLISVSAAHNWPYVLALLLWLVELCLQYELFDEFETMYPSDIQDTTAVEINEINFRLLAPHLINAFNTNLQGGEDDDDIINQYIVDLKMVENLNDEDIEKKQEEYEQLERENNSVEDDMEYQKLTDLRNSIESMNEEMAQHKEFINNGKAFVYQVMSNNKETAEKIEEIKLSIESLKKKVNEVRLHVNNQKLSYNDKQKMNEKMEKAKEDLEYHNRCIADYTNMSYAEDLKATSVRNQFENLCLAYNKDVIEYCPFLPELEKTKVNHNILHQNALLHLEQFDEILKNLKADLSTQLEVKQEAHMEIKLNFEQMEKELLPLKGQLADLIAEEENIRLTVANEKKSLEKDIEICKDNIADLQCKIKKYIDCTPDMKQLTNEVASAETELTEIQQRYDVYAQNCVKMVAKEVAIVKEMETVLMKTNKKWFSTMSV